MVPALVGLLDVPAVLFPAQNPHRRSGFDPTINGMGFFDTALVKNFARRYKAGMGNGAWVFGAAEGGILGGYGILQNPSAKGAVTEQPFPP